MNWTPARKRLVAAGGLGALSVGVLLLAGHLRQPWFTRLPREVPAVDKHRLLVNVNRLVAFHTPRSSRHPDTLARAADYLESELRDAGAAVSRQTFTLTGSGPSYHNVIGRYGPDNGKPLLVVGAHYDAHGEFPGADDNASGVAVMLSLARLLQQERELKGPVALVAFTLEERTHLGDGLQGSTLYAFKLEQEKVPVHAMLSLEMLGTYVDAPGSQSYPFPGLSLLYPDTGNFVAVVAPFWETAFARTVKGAMAGAASLPVESINAPGFIRGVHNSDHYPFQQRGIRAAMVTDTAWNRNPRYHTDQDTVDTLDYARMAEAARGVFGAVMALDAER
ncbi:MAG: putative rane protein [Pseudomonadota bacterium]